MAKIIAIINEKGGAVSQGHNDLPKALANEITARYLPCDYCCTADIPDDIHMRVSRRFCKPFKSIRQSF